MPLNKSDATRTLISSLSSWAPIVMKPYNLAGKLTKPVAKCLETVIKWNAVSIAARKYLQN